MNMCCESTVFCNWLNGAVFSFEVRQFLNYSTEEEWFAYTAK